MSKTALYSLLLLLWAGMAQAEPLEFMTINHSLLPTN
jgi:hypothetical protein